MGLSVIYAFMARIGNLDLQVYVGGMVKDDTGPMNAGQKRQTRQPDTIRKLV